MEDMMYKRYIKRFIDIVLSFIGLAILVIPMMSISIIVKLDSGAPTFFWQKRVGKHKTTFMIHRFCTLDADITPNVLT